MNFPLSGVPDAPVLTRALRGDLNNLGLAAAKRFLERAVALDPDFDAALNMLGCSCDAAAFSD